MKNQLHLKILVFISGMSVMAVEMTGLRLLAPFFGTSLVVTTVLIGSMMAFLSLGYWLGGRYGDKHPDLRTLCGITGAASLVVMALPFVGQPILRASAGIMLPMITGSGSSLDSPTTAIGLLLAGMLGVLALFALPVTLMGMVSPWAVRLAVDEVESSGKVAGRLYALSTFGSILGSFLPALVLLPLLGVRNTFVAAGLTLFAVSAVGFLGRAKGAAATAACLPIAFFPQGLIRPVDGLVLEQESLYHFIQVVIEDYGSCDEAWHLYLNEGVGVHSVKCLDPNTPIRGYWAYLAAAPLYHPEPHEAREALIIGLAGGTVARQLLETWPELHVDGVEIDGDVVEVGMEYFDNGDPRVTPYVMDGRVFLQAVDKRYDLILVDAYRQPYIPFHLTTVEFWREVAEHLEPNGVVAINVASVRGVSRSLGQMIYRTMREVFPSVHYVDAIRSNDVLYATLAPTSPEDMLERYGHPDTPRTVVLKSVRRGLRRKIIGEVEGWEEARVLTDDQAPVELAWDMMAIEYAR